MLLLLFFGQAGDRASLVGQISLDSLPESLVIAAVAVVSRLLLLPDDLGRRRLWRLSIIPSPQFILPVFLNILQSRVGHFALPQNFLHTVLNLHVVL